MEITVTSIPDYLSYIEKISTPTIATSLVGSFTFYRGQAEKGWNLSPGLYRNGLFEAETLLLTELKHVCPLEFNDSKFDTLVKMQHFGLPTRLLDITTNPLVALYFACEREESRSQDGAVYVFPHLCASWSTDPLVEFIMDYVFDYAFPKVCLDDVLSISRAKYATSIHRAMPDTIKLLLDYLTIPTVAVMATKSNPRIEAQEGAFLVFGMRVKSKEISMNPGTLGKTYCTFEPAEITSPTQISKDALKFIIPSAAKEHILNQLDHLGINEQKIFPDLPHQIKHTVKAVKTHFLK